MAKINKMRNVKTTVDGIIFDSMKEARRYHELKLLQRAGEICDLVIQPDYAIIINGHLVCKYIADFSYNLQGGAQVVEDVKGMKSGAAWQIFRIKAKLMQALYGIEVQVI